MLKTLWPYTDEKFYEKLDVLIARNASPNLLPH